MVVAGAWWVVVVVGGDGGTPLLRASTGVGSSLCKHAPAADPRAVLTEENAVHAARKGGLLEGVDLGLDVDVRRWPHLVEFVQVLRGRRLMPISRGLLYSQYGCRNLQP